MKVSLCPELSFDAQTTTSAVKTKVGSNLSDNKSTFTSQQIKYNSQTENEKTSTKRITDSLKFFINAKEMTAGTAKGLLFGALGTLGIISADNFLNSRKINKQITQKEIVNGVLIDVKKMVQVKRYGTYKGKLLAGAVGILTLVYHLVNAKFKAHMGMADIDHKFYINHK